jgi:hypothetical protein
MIMLPARPLPSPQCHSLRSKWLILVLWSIEVGHILSWSPLRIHTDSISRNGPLCDRPISKIYAGAANNSNSNTTSSNSSNNNDTSQDELLERARQLREQARAMEDDLRRNPSRSLSTSSSTSSTTSSVPVEYTELASSVWTISYRFSSQPAPADDQDRETKRETRRMFYTGKIQIRFQKDGYSEQVKLTQPPPSDIQIVKVWGWDQETSSDDQQEYILFSMDVKLPPSDPDLPNQTVRYYFQARIETEKTQKSTKSILQLRDGTITVKKDVAEQTNGRWGLFNVAGILSQFRYCGDFVAKASSS